MNTLLRRAVFGGLLALGLIAPVALAEKSGSAGQLQVDDGAGAFTAEGVKKAKDAFHDVSFASPTHMRVVTIREIPADKKKDFDAVAKNAGERGRFFDAWAREMAQRDRAKGVFVLMYVDDTKYIVRTVADKETDRYRSFTDADTEQVAKKLSAACERALKKPQAEAQSIRDAGLLEATSYVADQLRDTSVPEGKTASTTGGGAAKASGGMGIMGWVCIGLMVLLAVWLVVGLIRAFTGGGGGGGGYGPGGGGGFGGFFPSLMGGLFGAAAGMWLYDQFAGSSAHAADPSGGTASDPGAADSGDTGAGNFDDGASGGSDGGDWGGGDAGGGDWGGGGDFGGGDW